MGYVPLPPEYIVSKSDLEKAMHSIVRDKKATRELSEFVLSFFGFNTHVLDNVLEAREREQYFMIY